MKENIDVLNFDWVLQYFREVKTIVDECDVNSPESKMNQFDKLQTLQQKFEIELNKRERHR